MLQKLKLKFLSSMYSHSLENYYNQSKTVKQFFGGFKTNNEQKTDRQTDTLT